MLKDRLQQPEQRPLAQRVLAHALDVLVRLLHPITPFITEEIWQLLNGAAAERGLTPALAEFSAVIAPWPTADRARQDPTIESRFAVFQSALGALREIRSRQNIPPKAEVEFYVRCDTANQALLDPMRAYFARMANAKAIAFGEDVQPPQPNAVVTLANLEIVVDLKNFIDVGAEITRLEKQERDLVKLIEGKHRKLANESFVQRAPADVVQREREGLEQLEAQIGSVRTALAEMRRVSL
jgi:valyl-tRNA synthetase